MGKLLTTEKGFYDPELTVRFMKLNAQKTGIFHGVSKSSDYQMVLVSQGNFETVCKGKTFPLKSGDVFIAKPFEDYKIKCFEDNKIALITIITFHQNLFKNTKGDNFFLRVFDNREPGSLNLYKSNFLKGFSIVENIEILKNYTTKNLGFVHFSSVVSTIISQLDIAFDNISDTSSSSNSNEYSVKVWDYIASNCMTMITAEEVCEKFYVSKWYVDKVTKQFYGKPFHQTVKSMRMWHAKALMVYKHNLNDISKLCGYSDYSAFYRAYSSFFGVSPKKEYLYYVKHKNFISDKNNDTFTASF